MELQNFSQFYKGGYKSQWILSGWVRIGKGHLGQNKNTGGYGVEYKQAGQVLCNKILCASQKLGKKVTRCSPVI
jgi:hypothetical protein